MVVAVANCLVYEAGLGEASSGVTPCCPLEPAQSLGISQAALRDIEKELRQAAPRIEGLIGAFPEE